VSERQGQGVDRRLAPAALATLATSAILATLAAGCASVRADRAIAVASGSVSQTICSGTFVSGLDPERVYAETMRPQPGMGLVDWALRYDVDRERGEVRTTVAGGFASRAIHRDGLGCVLVHEAEPALPSETFRTAEAAVGPATPVEPANEALRAALDRAFVETEGEPPLGTTAVVVLHEGRIVGERYAPGYGVATSIPGNSVTKSVVDALIGILVRQGRIVADRPAPVKAWSDPRDPRHAITVEELLRMTSGLPFDEEQGGWDASSRMWFLEPDMAAFAEKAELDAPPGTTWAYSDGGYSILARIIRDAVGGHPDDVIRFVRDELLRPVGMQHTVLESDSTGTPIGSRAMLASARDWARFGQLYLDDGVAGGRRILPEGWVRAASTQTLDTGYGAGFWINVVQGGEVPVWGIPWGMPGAPRDAFFGRGYLGQ